MKKISRVLLWLALSLPLSSFSIFPRTASEQKPVVKAEFISQIGSDGSGRFVIDVTVDKKAIDLLPSISDAAGQNICESLQMESTVGSDWTEEDLGDKIRCHYSRSFGDLEELKTQTVKFFSSAHFSRLEITGGHLFYDLAWNTDVSYQSTEDAPFTLQFLWILKMPGDVVSTNASQTSGRTLTWNLMTLNRSSHIQAESTLSSSILGIDPILAALGAFVLLGCCCVLLLAAGGAVFFLIRRKSASANSPVVADAGSPNP